MTVQGPITFQDVAASFTEEQWALLEDWQKEIYKTVIKEIHEAIISLGYTIIDPDVVFSVRKQDDSCVRVDDQSVEKNAGNGVLPDLFLKVKAAAPIEVAPEKEQITTSPSPDESSASSIHIIEVDAVLGQTLTSSPPKKSNSFLIKAEEEGYAIDEYNVGGKKHLCPSKGGGLVKHESDEETDTEEDFQERNGGDKASGEDSSSLESEAKKRKIGPQVHGDILSMQEREARRIRVLEGMVKPFQAQPSFMFDPIHHQEVKEELPEVPDIRRDIRNTSWCKCGHCCVMSTLEESICCHEISALLPQLNDERLCITKHPSFQEMCLDKDRLDFLYRFLGKIKRKNDVLYYLHKLRRTSYRAFVVWAHGFLNFRKYKLIPACVVKHVQEFLPYPEELNVGYMKMYDYAAAIMALDHI
ncbi:uncharacterized protein ACNLHF_002429 [Anomaloglossus baeobatrachus]|uniref:uncharacterized protein LOC142256087 n=1 Tax=Anomaloglossus baeobatrachus TaxID=238106 RepID=UPI003F50CF2C